MTQPINPYEAEVKTIADNSSYRKSPLGFSHGFRVFVHLVRLLMILVDLFSVSLPYVSQMY